MNAKKKGPTPGLVFGAGRTTNRPEDRSRTHGPVSTPLGWRRADVAGRVWFYRRVASKTGRTGPVRVEVRITDYDGFTLNRTLVCASSHWARERFALWATRFNPDPLRPWHYRAACEVALLKIADELDSAAADEARARQ